ncbi:hypothetical protein [Lysobacter niastensis]|uniref:Uncharacterized protein n=1 Tax=Lysobacter niastensis TaxID=380629 RepID=A0ABS0B4J2_9GAMM|nr:hypothetical protein [Lysobacter niastensis]MBF6023555.1 hypothetical protein [Lysobacter niastensis]
MNHPRHEPLTPEERALAERLARIGPHADGPPPALDARILAAAHAAVAVEPRRRRWLALTGVPASLITGAGMAAALALVVGVVWQMQPASGPVRAPKGETADMGYVSAEMIRRERAPAPPPPPPPPEAPAAPALAVEPPAPRKALTPPAEARREAATPQAAAAPAQAANVAEDAYLDEAVVDAPAPAAPAGYSRQHRTPPAGAMAPAPASAPSMASPAADEPRFVPAPPAPPAPAAAMAQRKAVAIEAESRAKAAAAEEDASKQSLDTITVTGSRIRMTDIPPRDDARLSPDDWLERIRQRRDDGDLDGARTSLMLFRREHPHRRVPDGLRALPAGPER